MVKLRELRSREGNFLTEYSPSRTEQALEELCNSFGTELEPAYLETINNLLLVRLSRPVVLSSNELGEQLLQFQYTKFSALNIHDSSHLRRVYQENVCEGNEEITDRDVQDYMLEQIGEGEENLAKAVIRNDTIRGMELQRFPKEVYIAAFSTENEQAEKSFTIHEAGRNGYRFSGNPATFFMRYRREPRFFIDTVAEPEEKNAVLLVSWPASEKESISNLERAIRVGGGEFSREYRDEFSDYIEISHDIPAERVMTFIRSFIRQSLDRTVF